MRARCVGYNGVWGDTALRAVALLCRSGILIVRKENVINLREMMRVSSEDFRYVK